MQGLWQAGGILFGPTICSLLILSDLACVILFSLSTVFLSRQELKLKEMSLKCLEPLLFFTKASGNLNKYFKQIESKYNYTLLKNQYKA